MKAIFILIIFGSSTGFAFSSFLIPAKEKNDLMDVLNESGENLSEFNGVLRGKRQPQYGRYNDYDGGRYDPYGYGYRRPPYGYRPRYEPTTPAPGFPMSLFATKPPERPYYNSYYQDRYGPMEGYPYPGYFPTTAPPPPFPLNLFIKTTEPPTPPPPFPMNLFQPKPTDPPPPFPLSLFITTTPKPFFGLGKK